MEYMFGTVPLADWLDLLILELYILLFILCWIKPRLVNCIIASQGVLVCVKLLSIWGLVFGHASYM